jgi:hypothetical protein
MLTYKITLWAEEGRGVKVDVDNDGPLSDIHAAAQGLIYLEQTQDNLVHAMKVDVQRPDGTTIPLDASIVREWMILHEKELKHTGA